MSLFVKHCRQTKHSIGILSTCMTAYCGMRSKATEIHTSNPLVVQGHRQSNHQRQTPRIVSPDFSISLLAVSTSIINGFLFYMCVRVALDQRNLPTEKKMYRTCTGPSCSTSAALLEGCVDPAPLIHICKIEIYLSSTWRQPKVRSKNLGLQSAVFVAGDCFVYVLVQRVD